MKRIIKVESFIYNEKKDNVLLTRQKDLSWTLPGGVVRNDQTLEDALRQLVAHQTDVDLCIDALIYCKERKTEWEHVCTFLFRTYPLGDFDQVSVGDTIIQAEWVSIPTADNMLKWQTLSLAEFIRSAGSHYENLIQ